MAARLLQASSTAIFAAVVAVGALSCRWDFHDCVDVAAGRCSVLLRGSLGCENASDPVVRHFTRRRAQELLSAQDATGLTPLCDWRRCRVAARPCAWSPWREMSRRCPHASFRRRRERCCHPTTGARLRGTALCGRPETARKRENVGCSGEEPLGTGGAEEEDVSPETVMGAIGVCTFLLFTGIVISKWKRRDPPRATVEEMAPVKVTYAVPDLVIVPQPGQPISAQHLPDYLRA